MSHKNYASLRKSIMDRAKENMEEDVMVYVKNKMHDAIKNAVYDMYTPIQYDRRRYDEGLLDRDNVVGGVDKDRGGGFDWVVENTTKTNFGGSPQIYLAPLVILGQLGAESRGYDYQYLYYEHSEYTGYGKPRDFIKEFNRIADKNTMASLLKYGFINK